VAPPGTLSRQASRSGWRGSTKPQIQVPISTGGRKWRGEGCISSSAEGLPKTPLTGRRAVVECQLRGQSLVILGVPHGPTHHSVKLPPPTPRERFCQHAPAPHVDYVRIMLCISSHPERLLPQTFGIAVCTRIERLGGPSDSRFDWRGQQGPLWMIESYPWDKA